MPKSLVLAATLLAVSIPDMLAAADGGQDAAESFAAWVATAFGPPRVVATRAEPPAGLTVPRQNCATAPFSFLYDGQPSDERLPAWQFSEKSQVGPRGLERVLSYQDRATGLLVEAHVTELREAAAIDWVLDLENTGPADTPLIEHLAPLDAPLLQAVAGPVTLRWSNGDRCAADSFLPHDETLAPGTVRQFSAWSSNPTR